VRLRNEEWETFQRLYGLDRETQPLARFLAAMFSRLALTLAFLTCLATAEEKPFTFPGLKQDIEFAKVGDVSLTLDAFVPEGSGPFATCILVHGGGFTKGDKHSFITPLFEPLAKAGFTWFTINYRLAPQHRWPACAEDVASAIRWVKAHAADYKVDVNRIAIIGESAGGHLVSWAGGDGRGRHAGGGGGAVLSAAGPRGACEAPQRAARPRRPDRQPRAQ
jgi:acetyl esterase/lipase